jgi:hypothetical protein
VINRGNARNVVFHEDEDHVALRKSRRFAPVADQRIQESGQSRFLSNGQDLK